MDFSLLLQMHKGGVIKSVHRVLIIERTNLSLFSSLQAGLFIDKGVKTTNASAADKREYLSLDNNAR